MRGSMAHFPSLLSLASFANAGDSDVGSATTGEKVIYTMDEDVI